MAIAKQATRASNRAQIMRTVERQRMGLGAEFAHTNPVLDAVFGLVVIACIAAFVAIKCI